METQKTTESQRNIKHKEQGEKYHNTWFQIILHSQCYKSSMVLAPNRCVSYEVE